MYKEKSVDNKKICHVTSAHNRYDVRIFHKECKSLAKHGFDVILLVNDNIEDELIDGVRIKSTHFKPKNRFERMVISQRKIKEEALSINADIYHFHDPELLPLASNLKSRGKKIIFDFHEDVSQQIIFKTWIPANLRKIVSNIYKVYESMVVKNFNALITVTPKFVDRLSKINPFTVMVTNYPILRSFKLNDEIKSKTICFAGGVSPQWNHINIIKAIKKINNINYILVGSASEEYLNSLKALDGWEKVNYLGRIPYEEVKAIYSKSMVGMTLLSNDTQVGYEGTLGNTKLFEFMEAGLPIICSNNKLWKEIVEKHRCGIAINPNNIEEIKNSIEYIVDNPVEASEMGKNGRKAVLEKYNWSTQEKVLLDVYVRI